MPAPALEFIQPGDWDAVARVVDALRSLLIDTGGVSLGVRAGVTTITWDGSGAFSDFPAVEHGLGREPLVVIPAPIGGLTGGKRVIATAYGYTDSEFFVDGVTDDRSTPSAATALNVGWVAIG